MDDVIPAQFHLIDQRFARCGGDHVVERLHTGLRKAEGPAYFAAGRYLVWSDIPNDQLMRWDETTGAVGVFRRQSGYANGNTIDRQGRLITCEQGNRRLTRTEHDATLIGKLLLPEPVSNLTFGGIKRNHLFITGWTSLYALRVTFNGARYPA